MKLNHASTAITCVATCGVPATFAGEGRVQCDSGSPSVVDPCRLDFAVSVRDVELDALGTDARLDIEAVFTRANEVFADALDGQLKFGRIEVYDEDCSGPQAEVWIEPGVGRNAVTSSPGTFGGFGTPGEHITLFYEEDIALRPDESDLDEKAYTVARLMLKHVYGLGDEFRNCTGDPVVDDAAGIAGNPVFDPDDGVFDGGEPPDDFPQTFSIMDDFRTLGGRFGNPTGPITLNELSIFGSIDGSFVFQRFHDPDGDTCQTFAAMANPGLDPLDESDDSGWATVENHPDSDLRAVPQGAGFPPRPQDVLPPSSAALIPPGFVYPGGCSKVVICLDRSGSMREVDAGVAGSNSRLEEAVMAAEIVGELFLEPGDLYGIVSFNDDSAKEFPATTDPLFMIPVGTSPGMVASMVRDNLDGLSPDGVTSVARGLLESQNLLAASTFEGVEKIYLISDGIANRNSEGLGISDGVTQGEIATELSGLADMIGDLGTTIDAIAIGSGAYRADLQEIATESDGRYFDTTADFRAGGSAATLGGTGDPPIRNLPLAVVLGELQAQASGGGVLARGLGEVRSVVSGDRDDDADADFDDLLISLNDQSPPLVSEVLANYGSTEGEQVLEVFVDALTNEATFLVPWSNQNDDFDISLRSPSGTKITRTSTSANIDFFDGGMYEYFRVRRPTLETGAWDIIVSAAPLAAGESEDLVIGDGSFGLLVTSDAPGTDLIVSTVEPRIVAPDMITVTAIPTLDGLNIAGATVSGDLVQPDGTRIPINLVDVGNAAAGDIVPGDGVYAASITPTGTATGLYTVELNATLIEGQTTEGEPLFSDRSSNARPVPELDRVSRATIPVVFPSGEDCNGNGSDDANDILFGRSFDFNANNIPDECDLATGILSDCNNNGVADVVDIELEMSMDQDANGVPDECEGVPDLIVVGEGIELCDRTGAGSVLVQVANVGSGSAEASTAELSQFTGQIFESSTAPVPSLMPGDEVAVAFELPDSAVCDTLGCEFFISVDVFQDIDEENERNNTASGRCPSLPDLDIVGDGIDLCVIESKAYQIPVANLGDLPSASCTLRARFPFSFAPDEIVDVPVAPISAGTTSTIAVPIPPGFPNPPALEIDAFNDVDESDEVNNDAQVDCLILR